MDAIKSLKCIICLVKCSKYLYFAKKLICIMTMLISAVMLIGIIRQGKGIPGLVKGLM